MIRISLPYVFHLCEQLSPLAALSPKDTLNDKVFDLWTAQAALEGLLSASVFSANMRSSRKMAAELSELLKQQADVKNDWEKEIGGMANYISRQYLQLCLDR